MDALSDTQQSGEMESNGNSILIPFNEFEDDVETKLGRANGNIYQREQGVEGVHDGQIMVRLKKKRFIIIDYSLVPTPEDIAHASVTPSITIPNGAGRTQCSDSNCSKVGVPVCLYDSNPEEPVSLYLRSGLCFTCQRVLNEKRRTQRKKKNEDTNPQTSAHEVPPTLSTSMGQSNLETTTYSQPQKRFRLNGEILDLNPDAIIINGPLNDTKHHGPGYEFPEIITDLQTIAHEVTTETTSLANAISNPNQQEHVSIMAMYEKTFLSMSKGIFLLSQWKASWDSAVASAVAEKEVSDHAAAAATAVTDGTIAEAVASAAAVAAASGSSSTMVPLLIAAQADNGDEKQEQDEDAIVEDTEIYGV